MCQTRFKFFYVYTDKKSHKMTKSYNALCSVTMYISLKWLFNKVEICPCSVGCYLKGIYAEFLETSRLWASSGVIFRYITYEDKNHLMFVFKILIILRIQKHMTLICRFDPNLLHMILLNRLHWLVFSGLHTYKRWSSCLRVLWTVKKKTL